MVTIITIPKKVTEGEELVVISKKEYERFLQTKKTGKTAVKEAIDEGLRDLRAGRVTPAFSSIKEFKRYLKKK